MYAFRGIYIPKLIHIWYDVLRRDHCALRKGAFAYEMGHLARGERQHFSACRPVVLGGPPSAASAPEHGRERPVPAGNADVAEVLRRSESIYRQAAGSYNETLHRPWIYIPGRLMGFHYEEAAKVPGRVHI
mgnify:CR=1 FL=1